MRISDWSSDVCSSDLPRRTRPRQSAVPAADDSHQAATRRLGAYLRHRSGPHRPRQLLRAGGQCTDTVGRVLYAGRPGGDAAPVPRPSVASTGAPGPTLPRYADDVTEKWKRVG